MSVDGALLARRFADIIGGSRVLTDPEAMAAFQQDWRGRYRGSALAVLMPSSTQEVAALVKACVELQVAIVPQGGNTGLTGGAVAPDDRPAVILNLSRLNRIREVDARNNSLTVEAGCILAHAREAAEASQRQFPLLLGSVGSCEIGGLVSTNAGGTGVLRYGNMRELVLGLEVVLPDGRVWDGLRALRKDNAGYDLKQLFIGAEGTLGIVTAAVLKLHPQLNVSATAMVALAGVRQAVDLLRFMQEQVGNRIEAFEIMSRRQIELVLQHGHGLQSPMALDSPWYVLMEIADSSSQWDAVAELERTLEAAFDHDLLSDAVVATDVAKARRIWELRHNLSEANRHAGFTVSNDTSVPVSRLPEFIDRVTERIEQQLAGAQVCHAGHIGDGNIHVIAVLSRAVHATAEQCEAAATQVNLIVHAASVELGGSISAEHGIGRMHVARLERFKPALDLQMMRTLKQAFDPMNLMNPGKILRA
ncbi:FAD linked oxidase domain-containing protein [Sphaerotilus natans subsp. natans DSM 6575]|uniref:FAD linked oxidase domain-containing protein n=1 Tax=Sphaerotilus natans subsp. natans DSM 6575 TaxID=1286631 RepID=A0A059KG00_9BURK|nr:FAD-binding oxidoreductase [Sphaerotilus natans]KDB50386.1 FAD linked oxidase domain-containing protein [Sphaerotilus natans subsp. natans DSM 6575]SIS07199.1 FAD/FMN-containing dehydrogenase [Sphaerotilus natans]